jgi:hypothetical protein
MMGKITILIAHIQRETRPEPIQREWRKQTQEMRQVRWNKRNSEREHLKARINTASERVSFLRASWLSSSIVMILNDWSSAL